MVAHDLGFTRCFSVASMKEKRYKFSVLVIMSNLIGFIYGMVFEMVFELRRLSQQIGILQAGGELWKIWSKISKDEDLLKKIQITEVMDPNLSLRKVCLGEDIVVISSDKVEGSGDWNSLEFQDTANSG
ncbi:hypothetical protein Tco_0247299 [Tanacetum coccineum]